MNKKYIIAYISTMLVLFITIGSDAQGTKTKTLTIVNGDTTITESNLDKKEVAKMEKEVEIIINDDGKEEKKIVKKITIKDDKKEGETMAYAYAIGDDGDDVEIATSEDGKEMNAVVKAGEAKDSKEKNIIKTIILKEKIKQKNISLFKNII